MRTAPLVRGYQAVAPLDPELVQLARAYSFARDGGRNAVAQAVAAGLVPWLESHAAYGPTAAVAVGQWAYWLHPCGIGWEIVREPISCGEGAAS